MSISVIVYIKEKGCSLRRFFITDDPFGFRIEQMIVLILLTFTMLLSLVPMSYYLIGTNYATKDVDVYSLEFELISIFLNVFVFLLEFALLVSSCGVGLIVSIISMIKKRFEAKVFDNEFIAFISTKDGMKIFKEFAKTEWSSENVLFYEEVMKYQGIKKYKAAKKLAKQIKDNFIENGSALEVNLSGETRRLTKKRIEEFKMYRRYSKFNNIFDESLKETKRNMRDTFARIRTSPQFKWWTHLTNVKIEPTPEECFN
jgi:hypothetical protein